jgi:hypothetical protein
MELRLSLQDDVVSPFNRTLPLRNVKFHHLTPAAQAALMATGRGVMWAHDMYNAMYPPKQCDRSHSWIPRFLRRII